MERQAVKYMLRRTRDALQRRLHFLEHVARAENSKRKNEAYTSGGTHENSGWEAAIQDEKILDHEISVISHRLQNSRVIEDIDVVRDAIVLGTVVQVEDLKTMEPHQYVLVGSGEGGVRTPTGLLVSGDAPLAKALLGRRVDDIVDVAAGKPRRLVVVGFFPYQDDRTEDQLV